MDKLVIVITLLIWIFSVVEENKKKKKKKQEALRNAKASDIFLQSESLEEKETNKPGILYELDKKLSEFIIEANQPKVEIDRKIKEPLLEPVVENKQNSLIQDARSLEGHSLQKKPLSTIKHTSQLKEVVKLNDNNYKKSVLEKEDFTPSELRRAIVLKEILDKPIALRE